MVILVPSPISLANKKPRQNTAFYCSTHYCRASFQLETAWGALAAIVQLKWFPLFSLCRKQISFLLGFKGFPRDSGRNQYRKYGERILRTLYYEYSGTSMPCNHCQWTGTVASTRPKFRVQYTDRRRLHSLCAWLSCKGMVRIGIRED